MTNKPLPTVKREPNNLIQDNAFYVIDSNIKNKYDIICNGAEISEFIGYLGWPNNISNLNKAQELADFLNKVFQFAKLTKQKEIQNALGLPSKEDIEDMIKEKVCDLRDDIDNFESRISNSNKIEDMIDKKISEHRHDFNHKYHDDD